MARAFDVLVEIKEREQKIAEARQKQKQDILDVLHQAMKK